MKVRKRLAKLVDVDIVCRGPFPDSVLIERDNQYPILSDIQFQKDYRDYLYTPAIIENDGIKHEIQMNFCNNPFCSWYGLQQKSYDEVKYKPSRYRMGGSKITEGESNIVCQDIPSMNFFKPILENTTQTISNWSLADEVQRLVVMNTVVPIKHDYVFHRDGCPNDAKIPTDGKEFFGIRGYTKSKSTKYQCRSCGKITNVLPGQEENFNYGQKRNDILPLLCHLLFGRMPVKRICEALDIGSNTFYSKVEWLYKKCLEFNLRHETQPLNEKSFSSLWINTDCMIYNLNNIKQKGKGKKIGSLPEEEKKLQTYIVCSTDMLSGYAFRSDVAFDSNITLGQVETDTKAYHCDHSYSFLRKNDRLTYPFCPQPPTENDSQSESEYEMKLKEFNDRKNYVEGCHVKTQYTALAHYILLSWQLNSDKWYFVSDDDSTLQSSIFKAFSDKFRNERAVYFTCQSNNKMTLEEAGAEALKSRRDLYAWANANHLDENGIWKIAKAYLASRLAHHEFYSEREYRGVKYPVRGNKPIRHPLPDKDEGIRSVNLISPITYIDNEELAELILRVNSRSLNNFFQEIRRRISILERPLVTARGDGKSYIYANYNPKYAQQLLTIFRTFYNFCWVRKGRDGRQTPAQRLGLTNKVFEYKDIIYFR